MASISRTICPLATPPIAGLQLICAMVPIFMVTNNTLEPKFAAAAAASQPACPAPTTITSYFLNISFLFHVKQYKNNQIRLLVFILFHVEQI